MNKNLTNTQKLIILVVIILGISALFSGFSIRNIFSSHGGSGKDQTFAIKGNFSDIEVDSDISDVRFYKTNDRNGKVVWSGPKTKKLIVSTNRGTLTIREKDKRPWFLRVGINIDPSEMKVYLPSKSYRDLEIRTDTGSVTVPSDFSFKNADIETDTGAVDFRAETAEELVIKTDTGSVSAEGISPEDLSVNSDTGSLTLNSIRVGNDLTAETDTGRITLRDITCDDLDLKSDTGAISLVNVIAADEMDIENDTGSVTLDRCDADAIEIRTDTGAIRGTLRSDKSFSAESGTGRVSVPSGTSGGPCVLRSGTGSIEISVPVR